VSLTSSIGRFSIALTIVALSCACTQAAAAPPYARVSQPTLAAGAAIAAPTTPILTITGRIATTNAAAGLALDIPSIEQLGLIRYTVHDPWLEEDLEFTGVLVTDLLRSAGAAPDATSLHITALDDYEVDISIADATRWPIMLATQTGQAPMAIAQKGPTRIVFPADPGIDLLKYKDLWVWQLKTIEVR
jgi:hypothetical protein